MGTPQGTEYEEVTRTPLETKQAAVPAAPGSPPASPVQDQGVAAPVAEGGKPSS